jgi:hypothetical protein
MLGGYLLYPGVPHLLNPWAAEDKGRTIEVDSSLLAFYLMKLVEGTCHRGNVPVLGQVHP